MKCSIWVPTHKRPVFLREALKSIRNQTAATEILEVLVSENSHDEDSQIICKEFPELPIRFYRNSQPASPGSTEILEYAGQMLDSLTGDCIAILHDDDWWATNHLQNGLEALAIDPNASSYFAAYFMVSGEKYKLQCHPTQEFWVGSGFAPFNELWKLSLLGVAVANLVDVPCSFSSVIAPAEQLKRAWKKVIESNNSYDADRTLAIELGILGPVWVNPTPEIFVRFHPGQDKNRSSDEEVLRFKRESLDYVLSVCERFQIDLGEEFDTRMKAASEDEGNAVCDAILFNYPHIVSDKLIRSELLSRRWSLRNDDQRSADYQTHGIPRVGLRDFLPPIILRYGRSILRQWREARDSN